MSVEQSGANGDRKYRLDEEAHREGDADGSRSDGSFSNFFERLPLGAYRTTPDGQILAANRALLALLGYDSFDELARLHVEENGYAPSYDRASFRQRLEEEGQIVELEAVWRRQDGSHILVRENVWVVHAPDGSVRYYEGTVEDITARRQVEHSLREKEDRYRQAVQNSPNPIFSIDGEGHIETWNNACKVIFQYDESILGQPYQTLLVDDSWIAATAKMVAHVFQNNALNDVEICYRCMDGSLRYMVTRLYPLLDEHGVVEACVFANTDISERKQAEAALWRRDRILQAVTFAAEHFLSASSWEEVIEEVLAWLGRATEVSRVYLLQNQRDAAGVDSVRPRYEWTAPGVPRQVDNPALQNLDWEAAGLGRWRDIFQQGGVVQGRPSNFLSTERQFLQSLGDRSSIIVPVFVARVWWGCLGFSDCTVAREWSASEVDALRAAASTLGNAIARRRVERQLRRRNRELLLLNRVIAAATMALEPQTVLEIACRELAAAFGVPQAGVALLDESGLTLEVVAEYVADDGVSALGEQIPVANNAATRYVLERREPLLITEVQSDPRMAAVRDLMERRRVASMLLLPLVAGERVVGTVGLDSRELHYFQREDIELAMNVVAAVTQVLEKARLLATEQENTSRLEQILELGTELATIRDEKQLLETLVSRAAAFADSSTCTVFLLDEMDDAVLVAQSGLGDEVLGMRVPLSLPPVRRAIESNSPVIVPDVDRDAPELRNYLVRSDVHAFYAYPMVGDAAPIGFITLSGRHPRTPPTSEVNAFRLLADRVAAALQNVRLLEAVSKQAAQLTALHEVDLSITNSLEPEEVYATIVESTARLLNCDLVNLFRWDAATRQFEGLATYGAPEQDVKGERFPIETSHIFTEMVQGPRPIAISNAMQDERLHSTWQQRFGVHAVLAVPLLFRERLIGFLVGADTDCPRQWSADDVTLAQSLAAQAAIAVTNARLHAKTRRLLHQSRQQARIVHQIVDTVPEGLLLLDSQRRVVLANPVAQQFLSLLGVSDHNRPLTELAGRPLSRLLGPTPEGKLSHELVIERPQSRVFEITSRALEAGPQAGGWVLWLHDATKEREQQTYLQAQDRLATVGQLAAGIAHDFNNIMAVIVLYAQALQRSAVPVKDRERLAAIYQQARRASSLIAQILDFSRRSVVERRPLNLLPFVKELTQLLQRTLPETITLELQAASGDYVVNADPTRLQQALMNLAVNARDAMPNGGRMTITLKHRDRTWRPLLPDMRPGNWIHLKVSDNGHGIEPDHLPHIFEPFFTTKAPGHGTGLGLAQVYGIVKQHDGFIDVDSHPAQGTIFHLYLPAFQLPVYEPLEPEPMVQSAQGETILVAEDDPAIREAIREILELLNYRVLLAQDGQEALEQYWAQREAIALVLSDMVMPRLNGAALYEALREEDPGIKMILFTGYPLDKASKAFVEESGVRWIQKPFTRDDIARLIRVTLGS